MTTLTQRSTHGLFFDIEDASKIPAIAEPCFLFNANVAIHPGHNTRGSGKATARLPR
jgi:hypothetical protein